MDSSTFLEKANQLISSSPLDRLSPKTRAIVEKDNYIIDVHCHFFDIKTINIKYVLLRFIKDLLGLRDNDVFIETEDPKIQYLNISFDEIHKKKLLDNKADTNEDWNAFLEELDYVSKQSNIQLNDKSVANRGIKDILKNIKLITRKNMTEVYQYYLDKYALSQYETARLNTKDLIVTALMMDLESGWEIKVRKNIKEQIQELKQISLEKPILPFFSVDPRRAEDDGEFNLYKLFLEAFTSENSSFFGVKIYPGLGYLPSDYRLLPIYEICQEKNIPILTHCGGESVTTHHKKIEVFRLNNKVIIEGRNRQDVASQLNDPKEWIYVLEKFKNLKLNLAHFGGEGSWNELKKAGVPPSKIATIITLMNEYPNVYADFSFNLINGELLNTYKNELELSEVVLNKSLYGTDFWVVCGTGNLQKKQQDFLSRLKEYIDKLVYHNPKRYLFH